MIAVEHLSLRQGNFRLADVSFQVEPGQYAMLMGRTGTGKTSLLEAICGLRPITAGVVRLGSRNVTSLAPAARGVGYVPQDGALFDSLTVAEQLGFALEIRGAPSREVRMRVEELSDLLEIRHLLSRYPEHLSGGETQRVALGRALAHRPRVLLLDEPLSALDQPTRLHMYQLLNRVRQEFQLTAVHVTHNDAEAAVLGDVILRLDQGQVSAAAGRTVASDL